MHTFNTVLNHFLESGDVTYAADYAEPGYEVGSKGVLFANWNEKTRYNQETGKFDVLDRTMKRLGDLAEKLDYNVEWSDEWATCSCGKAVRSSADSYGWKRSYAEIDGEIVCRFCVADDPSVYLESLEGKSRQAETIGIDLEANGYVKIDGDYAHGWHPGQNDSPDVVAKNLRKRGVRRFIFKIDDVGQFDVHFSVYVHKDETSLLNTCAKCGATLGGGPPLGCSRPTACTECGAHTGVESALPYDPGAEMGKALRGEPTDHYTMTSRTITPEEFVSGSWVKDK